MPSAFGIAMVIYCRYGIRTLLGRFASQNIYDFSNLHCECEVYLATSKMLLINRLNLVYLYWHHYFPDIYFNYSPPTNGSFKNSSKVTYKSVTHLHLSSHRQQAKLHQFDFLKKVKRKSKIILFGDSAEICY
jgi:hypothetical protein